MERITVDWIQTPRGKFPLYIHTSIHTKRNAQRDVYWCLNCTYCYILFSLSPPPSPDLPPSTLHILLILCVKSGCLVWVLRPQHLWEQHNVYMYYAESVICQNMLFASSFFFFSFFESYDCLSTSSWMSPMFMAYAKSLYKPYVPQTGKGDQTGYFGEFFFFFSKCPIDVFLNSFFLNQVLWVTADDFWK